MTVAGGPKPGEVAKEAAGDALDGQKSFLAVGGGPVPKTAQAAKFESAEAYL